MTIEELDKGVKSMGFESLDDFTKYILDLDTDKDLEDFYDSYNPPCFD